MLRLVRPDDPVLYAAVPAFTGNPEDLRRTAKDMLELVDGKTGIGMAAPQLGLQVRMFVMNIGRKYICINPEVVSTTGPEIVEREGCLTMPGVYTLVSRPENIVARWTDQYAQIHERKLLGLVARCFQHELDHLNGKCIWQPGVAA